MTRQEALSRACALLADMERRDAEQGGQKDRKGPPKIRCSRCGENKPDCGKNGYCAECRREYDREYYRQRRRKA